MPCYRVTNKRIGIVHICGDLGERCAECEAPAGYLCDYPVGAGRTCDRQLCADHASKVYGGLHYCAPHMAAWREYLAGSGLLAALENVLPFPGSGQQG